MNSLCHKYLNQNILPFVGREAEFRRLQVFFREFLEEGESKYALVTGASGSGKTRLIREFEEYLSMEFGDSCVIVHARYLEGNAAALTPIVNAFTATLSHQENLKHLLSRLQLLQPNQVENLPLAAGTSSTTLASSTILAPPLQVLLDSLSEIARRFPLVLILEDVHNVEDIPLFDQFFLGLSSAAKFVILSERSGASDRPGAKHVQGRSSEQLVREIALREEHVSTIIPLDNFRNEDIGRLFQILFDFVPRDALLRPIVQRSGGRPLALRTLLRQLVSAGVLLYDTGKWSEDESVPFEDVVESDRSVSGVETPLLLSGSIADDALGDAARGGGLLARFQREIDRLNEHEQIVVIHGALLGEQFDLRLLRQIIRYRLGDDDISDELFQRAIDLLTFKSIIRQATPSVYFYSDPDLSASHREAMNAWCYEFSHQHFWNTVYESARVAVAGQHELVPAVIAMAGSAQLPLYSIALLSITGLPFVLKKDPKTVESIEYFLQWVAAVVKTLWSVEPQQCLRLLTAVRHIRDEVTWRFGPELRGPAMAALLDLHTMLVEAFLRTGAPIEAERDLEHAAILSKFISASGAYSHDLQAIASGKVATLRAILHAARTSYAEFERCAIEARVSLEAIGSEVLATSELAIERARLLTLLARTKAEALLNTGKFKEADALIEQGMHTAQLLVDHRFDEYSLFYRAAVNSKLKQDQNEQAGELTQQIISLARARGNTLVETTFLFQAALAAFSSGKLQDALQYCDLGILNGRRYGIRFVEIMCNLWRIIIAGVQQDVDKIKECSQQLAMLVEDARIVAQAPNLLQRISLIEGRATAMNFLGRYHAALEFAEEAIQLAGSHQHDSFAAWAQNEKALALIGLGQFEEALNVAQACVQLAGEQRMAERMARTALVMAYTGLGRFDDARREADWVRGAYKERNPYYLRFAIAEARLLRSLMGSAANQQERQQFRTRLATHISEVLELVEAWQAPLLRAQIQKEFESLIPRKIIPENIIPWNLVNGSGSSSEEISIAPRFRLHTFGPLTVEQLSEQDENVRTNGHEPVKRESHNNGMSRAEESHRARERDSKVRQLIALLAVTRAETSKTWLGSNQVSAITRDALTDALWPEQDGVNVSNALYTTVKRARAFIGNPNAIAVSDEGYYLAPIVSTDCEEVLQHYSETRQARKRNALFSITFHYEQIVKISSGGPFMDGIYTLWLDAMRTRLATIRRTAAIHLIETNLDRGLLDRVEELCHALLALDEFDEEAIRGLFIVNARRRQTSQLIALFEEYAKKLKREFRTEPSNDLRSLYASLVSKNEESGIKNEE
ncbi:MAG TPA: AAA family ATPase [Candidatus Kapabacteria bacterium]|jgi:DNA-binding SARP family transcriptional activator|nr:AAA family ATPase [Candidatus Kapabacteria bacterium]